MMVIEIKGRKKNSQAFDILLKELLNLKCGRIKKLLGLFITQFL